MKNAPKRLRKLRIRAGLNQSQLAKAVGVTRAAASRWEQGDIKSILARNALSVAETLDTNVEYLFTGKNNDSSIDTDVLSRAIELVEQSLTGLEPKKKSIIITLVYQLIVSGKSVTRAKIREIRKAA